MQELKGNIRVFCRVRPELAADGASAATAEPLMQFPSSGAPAYCTFSLTTQLTILSRLQSHHMHSLVLSNAACSFGLK